jgi:hypothetical protein
MLSELDIYPAANLLISQHRSAAELEGVAEAIRSIGVSEVPYYRWRQELGGLKSDQTSA